MKSTNKTDNKEEVPPSSQKVSSWKRATNSFPTKRKPVRQPQMRRPQHYG